MINLAASDSGIKRGPRRLTRAWLWLTEPTLARSEAERRRSRVLSLLILTLAISAAFFLAIIVIGVSRAGRPLYFVLILAILALFLVAFRLNHIGYYFTAAVLIVACTVVGCWAAILINLSGKGSIVPLVYLTISVILSSFLLSATVTIILAAAQFAALFALSLAVPGLAGPGWPSLLAYTLVVAALSIVASYIKQRDLKQIDQQTQQLVESEARLRKLSVRDPLTGLFNRRYLEATLERELARAARKRLPLGVIMLDIDHFKRFNDLSGHAAGDAILQGVAGLLFASIRDSDIACRYGGEEFTIILPEASRDATRQRAEKICADARLLRIDYAGQTLERVTLSVGVAVFPDFGPAAAAVMAAADAALYRAKREGRDRVAVAEAA